MGKDLKKREGSRGLRLGKLWDDLETLAARMGDSVNEYVKKVLQQHVDKKKAKGEL